MPGRLNPTRRTTLKPCRGDDGFMTNRLADSLSPYLLSHAANPVEWWPWGVTAFAEAKRRDVPVFLSVGYAACHWCHVMAHESFEDPATAAMLNAGFVSIKVDREERPDVDDMYMAATTALTGRGGWPMSVWLDHQARPFYAGTYFPPTARAGMPSFREVLAAITDAWEQRRGELIGAADRIAAALGSSSDGTGAGAAAASPVRTGSGSAGSAGSNPARAWREQTQEAVSRLVRDFDVTYAGFGSAPKFPPSMVLEFLLRHHENNRGKSPDGRALEMVTRTCEAMARGGIYDQLGGGFARYSVDGSWQVPHFEKMLYDNAQLLGVYTHLARTTGSALASRVARETADFLIRDLRTAEGGFASALDADSTPPADSAPDSAPADSTPAETPADSAPAQRAVEGIYYVWTRAQLVEVLGARDGAWAADLLGVTTNGTFEDGASTLTLRTDPDDQPRWRRIRLQLAEARAERPRPACDDKVVAGWNGLAIASLTTAGVVFDEPGWIEAAREAADLLLRSHRSGRLLLRVSRGGTVGSAPGMLEDYANVIAALQVLHAATGEPRWLGDAAVLAEVVMADFVDGSDPSSGWYDAPPDSDGLLGRRYSPSDNAYPSGGSAAAAALLALSGLGFGAGELDATGLRMFCEAQVAAQQGLMRRHPWFAGGWLATLEALIDGPLELALIGPAGDDRTTALRTAAFRNASPGLVMARSPDGARDAPAPLLAGRTPVAGNPTAYVCRGSVCQLPVTTVVDLEAMLIEPTPDSIRS